MAAVVTGMSVILKLRARTDGQLRVGPKRFGLRAFKGSAEILLPKMFANPERNFVRQTVLQHVTVADDLFRRPMWPARRVLRLTEKTKAFEGCFCLRSVAGVGFLKTREVRDAHLFGGGGTADQKQQPEWNREQRRREKGSSLTVFGHYLHAPTVWGNIGSFGAEVSCRRRTSSVNPAIPDLPTLPGRNNVG